MQKISAVLIVKNESECLAKCLDSIKGVDEIIICDTGSEDNTIEIAKKYTDKVFTDFVWCDDFAKARNHALAKATGDWIISIDADEYLTDFNVARETIEKAHRCNFLTVNCKLKSERVGTIHNFPRIFKKCPEVWWEGAVHNHISVVGQIDSDVEITYGYSPAHEKDPGRALRILTKEVERTGNGRELFYLGREYWYRRDFSNCIKYMDEAIPKTGYLSQKADAYVLKARCHWALGQADEARSAVAHALIINPHWKEACLFMALLAGDGSGKPAWQKNADQWKRMAETADNTNVLFL